MRTILGVAPLATVPGSLECIGWFVMPPGSRISVRVGTDHFATGAGGERLINTELRGDVVQAVQQVASRLDGGSRCGNGHEGCVVGHGIAVAVGIARLE